MLFQSICVVHLSKVPSLQKTENHTSSAGGSQALSSTHTLNHPNQLLSHTELSTKSWPGAFHLETCQRWIWVFDAQNLDQLPFNLADAEILHGQAAYSFLLRLATGLESEVVGETDIFGQMKDSWKLFLQSGRMNPLQLQGLHSWMNRLFEDTKEIRSRYLQHLGGVSYGTLVRKLIKQTSEHLSAQLPSRLSDTTDGALPLETPSILIVGAGQIAHSIVPFFSDSKLLLWNRDLVRLKSFYEEVKFRHKANATVLLTRQDEQMAWEKADHIIVCIPLDRDQDAQRIEWFCQGNLARNSDSNFTSKRTVTHLGGLQDQCGTWNLIPQFYSLTDLFRLQNSLGVRRSAQIARAERACDERAILRALGTSLSIAHGWEDLACFV